MILDFIKKQEEKKEKINLQKAKNFQNTYKYFINIVNFSRNKGITEWELVGVCVVVLSKLMASIDPNLEKLHIRDLVHSMIDRQIDEEVIKIWSKEE